jgi:triphosphatase
MGGAPPASGYACAAMEIELKFQIPAAALPALQAALRRGRLHRTTLRARYFDTADGRLAAHAIALRQRREGRRWVQTLKAVDADFATRLEHDVALGSMAAQPPALDLARHDGTAAGRRLRDVLGDAPLVERFETDIRRTHRLLRAPGGLVEVALDEGVIRTGDRRHPVCELEFELKSGRVEALHTLALAWSQRHGLWLDAVPKSGRGRLLADGLEYEPPATASKLVLAPGIGGAALLRATIRAALQPVVVNAGELAAGSGDPEHVHQLRVGLRRLRTVLRELRTLSPALDPAWEAVLADSFRDLGAHRDAFALRDAFAAPLAAAGAPPFAWPAPAAAVPLPEIARALPLQRVLLQLLAFVHGEAGAETPVDARDFVAGRLKRLHAAVCRHAKGYATWPLPDQHRVRKRAKRLRYLGELASGLFEGAVVGRYLRRVKVVQEALGAHVDALAAAQVLRDAAQQEPAAWFGVGWLAGETPRRARACVHALERLAAARRFWR